MYLSSGKSDYKLNFLKDVYDYPYFSFHLGIGQYTNRVLISNKASIKNKCVLFIENDIYTVFPFVNSELFA